MPEISRFLGIVIVMHFREHNPPHFHVWYNEHEATVRIDTLELLSGRVPERVLHLVVEWAALHQIELSMNWNSLRTTGDYSRIAPLV